MCLPLHVRLTAIYAYFRYDMLFLLCDLDRSVFKAKEGLVTQTKLDFELSRIKRPLLVLLAVLGFYNPINTLKIYNLIKNISSLFVAWHNLVTKPLAGITAHSLSLFGNVFALLPINIKLKTFFRCKCGWDMLINMARALNCLEI